MRQIFLTIALILTFFLGGEKRELTLQESASRYIATTEKQALEVASQLVPDGGKPGNICGPLSLVILKDVGYVDSNINIKDFWFLRPWEKWVRENVVDVVLPPEEWEYHHVDKSLDNVDFSKFPLAPGDFLFFFYGYSCGGTFSHMLVVTEVKDGRAYSVTNHLTNNGWRIEKVLLYDLGNPSVYTFFNRLVDPKNTNTIGTTGLCGFYLWRYIVEGKTERSCPQPRRR